MLDAHLTIFDLFKFCQCLQYVFFSKFFLSTDHKLERPKPNPLDTIEIFLSKVCASWPSWLKTPSREL